MGCSLLLCLLTCPWLLPWAPRSSRPGAISRIFPRRAAAELAGLSVTPGPGAAGLCPPSLLLFPPNHLPSAPNQGRSQALLPTQGLGSELALPCTPGTFPAEKGEREACKAAAGFGVPVKRVMAPALLSASLE